MSVVPDTGLRAKPVIAAELIMAQAWTYSGADASLQIVDCMGFAPPGANESGTTWAIKKFLYDANNNVTRTLWASGTADFDKQWSMVGSYVYS